MDRKKKWEGKKVTNEKSPSLPLKYSNKTETALGRAGGIFNLFSITNDILIGATQVGSDPTAAAPCHRGVITGRAKLCVQQTTLNKGLIYIFFVYV